MSIYRTLTVSALSLSALAAHAAPPQPGDGEGINNPQTATQAPRLLSREAVIADLVASRKAGTLPADGEWYNVPAPLGRPSGAVPAGAKPAVKSNAQVSGDQ